MTRYFFDVLGRGRSEYDFSGTLFPDPQQAFDWAQLLAIDLEVAGEDQEFIGGRLGVRSIDGRELFSIPIDQTEMACA
jgi:Domain of unknown function (DUF6894)